MSATCTHNTATGPAIQFPEGRWVDPLQYDLAVSGLEEARAEYELEREMRKSADAQIDDLERIIEEQNRELEAFRRRER